MRCFDFLECGQPARCAELGVCIAHEIDEGRAPPKKPPARTEVVWLNPACSAALERSRGGLFAEA